MKTITKLDAPKLAMGIQQILLDMCKTKDPNEVGYPVAEFERLLMDRKELSREDAEYVTEKIIATGIIRWDIYKNLFVL